MFAHFTPIFLTPCGRGIKRRGVLRIHPHPDLLPSREKGWEIVKRDGMFRYLRKLIPVPRK